MFVFQRDVLQSVELPTKCPGMLFVFIHNHGIDIYAQAYDMAYQGAHVLNQGLRIHVFATVGLFISELE